MNSQDLSQAIRELVDSLGVEVDISEDLLEYGMRDLGLEDPHGVGAPVSLIWPSNNYAVVTIGSAARTEVPIDEPSGVEELLRIISALLAGGGAVEEGTRRSVPVTEVFSPEVSR